MSYCAKCMVDLRDCRCADKEALAEAAREGATAFACDAFITAVVSVTELYLLPRVWQVLPLGANFAAATRSPGWDDQRVIPAPPDDEE